MIKLQTILFFCLAVTVTGYAQEKYTPAPENIEAREWFQNAKFGLFIHWGVYSVLGDGEWVMNNQQIPIRYLTSIEYQILTL